MHVHREAWCVYYQPLGYSSCKMLIFFNLNRTPLDLEEKQEVAWVTIKVNGNKTVKKRSIRPNPLNPNSNYISQIS
jgi:hypothetical protein